MTLRVGTLACLIALLAFSFAGRAEAEQIRSRVAVVRTPSTDRLLSEANTRLRAELVAAGFDVVDVERAPGSPPEWAAPATHGPGNPRAETERASEGAGTFATVVIARTGKGALADVWVSDHVTGKTVVRRLRVGHESNAAAVLAIRALELLRASLLEVASAAPTAEATAPPPRDVLNWVKPTFQTEAQEEPALLGGTAVSLGVLGLHDLHDIGPAAGPTLRVSHGVGDHWFGRLVWAGPLFSSTLREDAGTATVRQQLVWVDVGWATAPRPLGMFACLGAGLYFLQTTGAAIPPYQSTSDDLLSFLATAGLGGVAWLGESVAVTADVFIVGLIPKPVVVIADREAGPAGGPSIGASLSLTLEL